MTEEQIDKIQLERGDQRRNDLILFLIKLSDEDLLKYTLEEHLEGYWMSLQKAAEEELNFKLEG